MSPPLTPVPGGTTTVTRTSCSACSRESISSAMSEAPHDRIVLISEALGTGARLRRLDDNADGGGSAPRRKLKRMTVGRDVIDAEAGASCGPTGRAEHAATASITRWTALFSPTVIFRQSNTCSSTSHESKEGGSRIGGRSGWGRGGQHRDGTGAFSLFTYPSINLNPGLFTYRPRTRVRDLREGNNTRGVRGRRRRSPAPPPSFKASSSTCTPLTSPRIPPRAASCRGSRRRRRGAAAVPPRWAAPRAPTAARGPPR